MAVYLQASAKAALPPGSSAPPAALSDFATTSGLAVVFGALNLSEDVHEQCLARTVQWFQDVGVRSRNTPTTPCNDGRSGSSHRISVATHPMRS